MVDRQTNSISYDFAVVGAGIIGMAIAIELARRYGNNKVAVIAPRNHNSASQAAGAMLSGYCETTHVTRKSAAGRQRISMRIEASRLWPDWIKAICEECGPPHPIVNSGTVLVQNQRSGPMEADNFLAILELLNTNSEKYSEIRLPGEFGLQPTFEDRPTRAVFIPNERYVNSGSVLSALSRTIRRKTNITVIEEECRDIELAGSDAGPFNLQLTNSRVHASNVIVASGFNTARITIPSHKRLPLVSSLLAGSGSAVVGRAPHLTGQLPNSIRTPNRAFSCGLHIVPGPSNEVYIGSTNNLGRENHREPILSDVSFLIDCATRQIDRRLSMCRLSTIHTASRPVSVDTFPLLGGCSVRGLWFATGTYRDGFLLAPLLANRLCDAIQKGTSLLEGADLFSVERKPISALDLSSAIDDGVANFLAIAYERGTHLPSVGYWEDDMRSRLKRQVSSIYSELGLDFVLPTDFLWDIAHGRLDGSFDAFRVGVR